MHRRARWHVLSVTSSWLAAALVGGGVLGACEPSVELGEDLHWPAPADVPPIGDGVVVVTNSGDDSVSWISLATLEEIYRMPVGLLPPEREGPHHGAASADGRFIYVGLSNFVPGSGSGPHGSHGTGKTPGALLKYDTATAALVGEVRVGRSPGDVRLTPDGTRVVQSHFDLIKIQEELDKGNGPEAMLAPIAIVDAESMQATMVDVCIAPHGLAISADSSTAFVACWASDDLAVVDLAARTVARFPVGATPIDPTLPVFEPYAVALHPTTGAAWVSNLRTQDLRVFEPSTGTWNETLGAIDVGGSPFFGAFSSDGAHYFVPVQGANAFVVVDTMTGAVAASVPLDLGVCRAPHAVLLTPDEQKALVVCEGDHVGPGTVVVVGLGNPLTPAPEKMIEVGVFPDDAFLLGGGP